MGYILRCVHRAKFLAKKAGTGCRKESCQYRLAQTVMFRIVTRQDRSTIRGSRIRGR
ncbi:unnamed protein product [Blumeria hordei]|uniref:Uncharacterized protein n=1 Tax=Blumeria hordei TaxID=2867405 RepID=A0A383UWQ3_BLUHO|nr:unnamed protein product [Blumeria hordei]